MVADCLSVNSSRENYYFEYKCVVLTVVIRHFISGQRDDKGGTFSSRHHGDHGGGERTHENPRDLTRTEDRETDTELDRRFIMSEGRDGRTRRSHEFGGYYRIFTAKAA